ncbi:hypothetical protein RFI_07665 [Reticulomyxa filosa]|uniref:Uncharacterized protein n=1 Tax=Reticulomyxa filosa TaxID=46433 RepID=X6NU56_RETFI|nr:hypothetical protein RFI_07665 [Reticulomyxa filosa]|eukprot:ETO29453.1 hypothetical protein RFI_07665 [Reticulomyxa filosa]
MKSYEDITDIADNRNEVETQCNYNRLGALFAQYNLEYAPEVPSANRRLIFSIFVRELKALLPVCCALDDKCCLWAQNGSSPIALTNSKTTDVPIYIELIIMTIDEKDDEVSSADAQHKMDASVHVLEQAEKQLQIRQQQQQQDNDDIIEEIDVPPVPIPSRDTLPQGRPSNNKEINSIDADTIANNNKDNNNNNNTNENEENKSLETELPNVVFNTVSQPLSATQKLVSQVFEQDQLSNHFSQRESQSNVLPLAKKGVADDEPRRREVIDMMQEAEAEVDDLVLFTKQKQPQANASVASLRSTTAVYSDELDQEWLRQHIGWTQKNTSDHARRRDETELTMNNPVIDTVSGLICFLFFCIFVSIVSIFIVDAIGLR